MKPLEGIEPSTYSLPRNRYTSKPQRQFRYCPEYQRGLFYFFPSIQSNTKEKQRENQQNHLDSSMANPAVKSG